MKFVRTLDDYNKLKKGEKYEYNCKICGKLTHTSKYSKKRREIQIKFMCRSCAIKLAVKEKYGVDNVFQLKEIKEKSKQTCLKKYGTKSYKQSSKGKEDFIKYSLKKYGTINPFQAEEIKEKSKQTCLEKYGTEYAAQSKVVQSNIEKTMEKKYGVRRALQNKKFIDKAKKTELERYGTFYITSKYKYDNLYFDSSWELAFYIYCKDNELNITREVEPISFIFEGKEHKYTPDFLVNNVLIEIKGEQFFDKNDEFINPYNPNEKELVNEKLKCMKNNNVVILRWKEMKKYIDYINNKYGKNYLNNFKFRKGDDKWQMK